MNEQLFNEITRAAQENRDALDQENLLKAIDELTMALPDAREKELDVWAQAKPSVAVRASRIVYEPVEKLRLYGARLLREEEFRKYEEQIPVIGDPWFLESSGLSYRNWRVYQPAKVVDCHQIIIQAVNSPQAIRPVLEVACHSSDLTAGSRFKLGRLTFLMLSDELAICAGPLAIRRYDGHNNDYEGSEIKALIDKWLKRLADQP